VVPLRENLTQECELVAEIFALPRQGALPPDWAPCLPFASQFPARAQYLYLHIALQLGIATLWFDFHVIWVQSPMPWLKEALEGPPRPPGYHHPCRQRWGCTPEVEAVPDIFLADEFYAPYWPKSSLMLLRPTPAVQRWIKGLLRWICTYPFASAKRGLHYFAHPDKPDAVPSVSMLPNGENVPRVVLGELDIEQRFVGFDGWFGDMDKVLSYEVVAFISDEDRSMLLEKLLMGKSEDIRSVLMTSKKFISPLRPTQRLYERFEEGVAPPGACEWQHVPGAYVGGFAAGIEEAFTSPQEAQCQCLLLGTQCAGVTCEVETPGSEDRAPCTLRSGEPPLVASPVGEESYLKRCADNDCDAPIVERIVHVNFADGCCEAEQRQSSETAQQFGADESRPLRGDFLDEDFKRRNHHLLTFNRTPELTQHKTPTGKIGYYVWKPYVVLKTVEDPSLPWDTTVIAWTDAGIHFVDDMRPLIRKYLSESDVAATRTPMMEADFSKRDAFILLDADYQSIMETSQVATGIILVRKTRLAVEFLQRWLKACEEPRIMTEEASVLGMPEHYQFKNNNDDQTAFSLLFKRYGFKPFSVNERDAVVYTGRNLAKFIKASDDFALGQQSDREAYLKAADEAAGTMPDDDDGTASA